MNYKIENWGFQNYNEFMARMVLRMVVSFEGHVQGVGFRMQTLRVARGFEVAGTVQNQLDGSVQLIVEGVPSEVRAFVDEVCAEMHSFIKKVSKAETTVPATLYDFKII